MVTNSAREIEIKLLLPDGDATGMLAHRLLAAEPRLRHMRTSYFDTPDWALSEARIVLRIRESDDRMVQCVKMPASSARPMERAEWDRPLLTPGIDLGLLPQRPRKRLERLIGQHPLPAFAVLKVERRVWLLRHGRSDIEVVLDIGAIVAGERREPIAEIELELKRGNVADLLDFTRSLPLGPQLCWSTVSKGQRAYALARDMDRQAARARPIRLSPRLSVPHLFQQIGWHCLTHFLDNYRLVIDRADGEALHQCRVALRRWRAACTLFRDLLGDDQSRLMRAELARLARALGPARNLDVITAMISKPKGQDLRDVELLCDQLARQRIATYADVRQLLDSESCQRLLFELTCWLEAGEWRRPADKQPPAPVFAAAALKKRWRAAMKDSRHIAELAPNDRHQLRIATKKLRYAVEFLAGLFPDRVAESRAMAAELGRMQDVLGDLNDLTIGSAPVEAGFEQLNAIERTRLQACLDAALDLRRGDEPDLIAAAKAVRDTLSDMPRFWKATH